MQVSVIIPVYNTDLKLLKECIASIENQTFSDFEILIVDDGSKAEYAKSLDALADEFSKIRIIHKQNEGVSVARNVGVKQANGEYILFADGDDLLTPFVLESAVKSLCDTGADVAIGRILQTSDRPDEFPKKNENPKVEILDTDEKRTQFLRHIFLKTCNGWGRDENGWMYNGEGCWAHLIRKTVANELPFVKGVAVGEDTIWGVQMLDNARNLKICLVDEYWYYYFQNNYSVMHTFNMKIEQQLTKPVSILNPMLSEREFPVYNAYMRWIFIKLKQIIYRFYLSEECELSFFEKLKRFRKLISNDPWKAVLKGRKQLKFADRFKLFLYRRNVMLPLFLLKEKAGGKK
ncbi:MAG: glycosyltransferase family 2 protein [Acutalibacteraceae bacterium]|nr:glycosyltransferase family 2 protein [Clostridia bacterium]MEE1145063.1 glycosyltransferase family 2 protein [Acutalibacteraceae bacterium]